MEKELRISEDIEIYYIELSKIMAQWRNAQMNPWRDFLVRWLLLLAANEAQSLIDTLEQDETLQKAIDKWDNTRRNQAFQREYEARIIRKMYDNGMTPQDITNHLEMNMAEVQRILELS